MLSREEELNELLQDRWIYCIEDEEFTIWNGGKFQKITRIKDLDNGRYYYWFDRKFIPQPRGYYCKVCLLHNFMQDRDITYEDGSPMKWWDQCNDCKLKSSRSFAAKKWTEVIKAIPRWEKEIKFATLTIKNPVWNLKNLGFKWEFHDDEMFNAWLEMNCRKFWDKKNQVMRWKYLGDMPFLMQRTSNGMRNKLKQKLKNLRNDPKTKGHKRWLKNVKGGIVAYEATMNVNPKDKTISLNSHVHCILNTKWYNQADLEEDWGLGRVDIRPVTETWKIQLEIAKYVGKDGSRRTAWGTLRKLRSKHIIHEKKKCEPLKCEFCHLEKVRHNS